VSLSQCCPVLSCAEVLGVLLPHLAGVVTERAWEVSGRVFVLVRPAAAEAACPGCGQLSGRRHGGYPRRLRDVPAGGRPVVIWLAARRFRCLNPACPKVTFTEQVEGLASRFARRTPLLAGALAAVAAVLAGRAGARLAAALAMPAGRDSMIRLVMAIPEDELAAAPAILGVDDFALRKGHVYGTVLVDMQTGDVVGLLADREAATLQEWLENHPGAAVICRDRAGAYADGARAGAPDAVQAADRWHLLHNLCEKTYQAAAAHRASCLGACPDQPPQDGQQGQHQPDGQQEQEDREEEEDRSPARTPRLPGRTRQRHAEIHQLLAAGHPKTAVARILGLSAPTVARYARAASPGELTPAARESALDPYKPYLIRRWNDGARDARVLHAEITAQGYTGCDQQVRRFVRPFRDLPPGTPAQAPPAIPSARKITTWLMTSPGALAADDAAALAAVTAACPHLRQLQASIRSFCDMITGLTGRKDLDAWLAAAEASSLDQLRSFARGIRKDHAAVLNGLSLPYSSGKVEGTVCKIKMIKRRTYGRASFGLLRKLVLLA
jgi:transposase